MAWIKLGTRWQPIFDKSNKLLAWSDGLNKELGFGFTEFITTSDGSQFVLSEEEKKINRLIVSKGSSIEYLDKTDQINEKIGEILNSNEPDLKAALELSITQLTYFYIANEQAGLRFESALSGDKRKIESWRNDENHFSEFEKLYSAIAKQLDISEDILEWMTLDEVNKALKGQVLDLKQIKERQDQTWSLVLKDGEIRLYLEDLSPVKDEIEEVKEIKGKSVFESDQKILGIVGNDIIVATMTHPDMVPEMRKMKVIITDEGGVLSHAAITCREFNIPGIIGTKVATKVLKRGDKVEVDLGKGTVKILK